MSSMGVGSPQLERKRRRATQSKPIAILMLLASLAASQPCLGQDQTHFNPDTDPDRIAWDKVDAVLGPRPGVRGNRYGIVLKTMTNDYWRLMAAGYRERAAVDGVKVDIQSAPSESDPMRQLAVMETMIGGFYQGLVISPQSNSNLAPAIADAKIAGIALVDVDGSVVDDVRHFVGATNREMGERVARWFIEHYPNGGEVAVIKGLPDIFSTVQRSAGFIDTLTVSGRFKIVSILYADWDARKAYDAATTMMAASPHLIGIYCINDTMALGAVDAVKAANRLSTVRVFGNDGTRGAYESIAKGELSGTVDIFPSLTAQIGLDIAERLSAGQSVPRVIETPEALATRDNFSRYRVEGVSLRKVLLEDAAAGRTP